MQVRGGELHFSYLCWVDLAKPRIRIDQICGLNCRLKVSDSFWKNLGWVEWVKSFGLCMYQQKWQKITRSSNQSLCGPLAFGPLKLSNVQTNIFLAIEFFGGNVSVECFRMYKWTKSLLNQMNS